MKKKLDELKELFATLSYDQLTSLKGGTGSAGTPLPEQSLTIGQLSTIFNYGALDPTGHNNQQAGMASKTGQFITLLIEDMYATPLGKDLLNQIYNKDQLALNAKQTYVPINLIDAPAPSGSGEYMNDSNHTFYLGTITNYVDSIIQSPTMSQLTIGSSLSIFSHEMFHAFEQIAANNVQGSNGGEITGELQAYMFSEMVSYQFADKIGNAMHDGSTYYETDVYGGKISDYNANDYENLIQHTEVGNSNQFMALFDAMLNSTSGNPNNFTLANYNQLIADFAATPLGQNYSKMKTDPATSTSNQDIFKFFSNDFQSANVTTPPAGVNEWYNPTLGTFEDTTLGQDPNAYSGNGFTVFVRSSDADVTAAAAAARTNTHLEANYGSVRVEGYAAAAEAASLAKNAGLSSSQISQSAANAVNAVVNINDNAAPSGTSYAGGVNVPVANTGSTVTYITIYPDSTSSNSNSSNSGTSTGGGHIDQATGVWFPDTTVVQGDDSGDTNYIDSPIDTGGTGGGGWGGGGTYYA